MKKIISLFERDYEGDRLIKNIVVPGAEWVLQGEGIATRKYDGTCCMIKGGNIFRRYDCKEGNIPPYGFIPAQDPDPITKHWPGWVKCDQTNPSDKWFFEAYESKLEDGTYELCGPKVQKNPEGFEKHTLIKHGITRWNFDPPRDFDGIKKFFELNEQNIEGIVWHHTDGRMVKIKAKDYGLKRRV
jgi:hypothetical protein